MTEVEDFLGDDTRQEPDWTSIPYLAPEQLERGVAGNILSRRRVTHVKRLPSEPFDGVKADCYAYGVLVARLHYGRAVSLETKQEQKDFLQRAIDGTRPDMPQDAPAHVQKSIAACWQRNPADRPNIRDVIYE